MSDPIVKPTEFTEAVAKLHGKLPVGADLSSEQWSSVPAALRDRAVFSARIAKATVLQDLRDRVLSAATPAEFVAKARPWMRANGLGRDATKDGIQDNADLRNHAGTERLKLIYEQNIRSARGYGWWKEGQNSDVMDAFPAQELVRIESRHAPRDWRARWAAFSGPVREGRMVALKSDGIWTAISRFGTPWPPFDFGSGMGVDDVTREEAEAMGLLQPGAPVEGDEASFNSELQASVKGLDQDMIDALKASFGDQVQVTDGVIHWKGDAPPAPRVAPAAAAPAAIGTPVSTALKVGIRGSHGDVVNTAIAAIDRVHGDGTLTPIPVGAKVGRKGVLGIYTYSMAGTPSSINVKKAPGYWPGLTTVHEIGHFIDHQAMGKKGYFASEAAAEFAEFRKAADASATISKIRTNPSLPLKTKVYLLKGREIWARAYAQYIAEASNDPALKLELAKALSLGAPQWDVSDFKPIFAAIENILKAKGWKQ